MYSSKGFSCKYKEFVDYETCLTSICKLDKGCRNTSTTRKQGIPNINMNMKSSSETLGFGCSPH